MKGDCAQTLLSSGPTVANAWDLEVKEIRSLDKWGKLERGLVEHKESGPLGADSLVGFKLPPRHFPEQINSAWRRFSNGLWRVPEGDISAAYCADTFPKLKAFLEDGQLF